MVGTLIIKMYFRLLGCDRKWGRMVTFTPVFFFLSSDESLQEFSSFLRNLEDQRELMVRTTSQNLLESWGKYLCFRLPVLHLSCYTVYSCTLCISNQPTPFTGHIWIPASNNVWLCYPPEIRTGTHNIIVSNIQHRRDPEGRANHFPKGVWLLLPV